MTTFDAYSTKCMEELGEAASDREFLQCVIKAEDETTRTQLKSIALIFAGVLVFAMQVRVCDCTPLWRFGFASSRNHLSTHLGTLFDVSICGIGWFCYVMCRLCSKEKYSKYVA